MSRVPQSGSAVHAPSVDGANTFGVLISQDEIAAMRRMLTLSEGTFSLSVAVCNSPDLRNRLIAEIQTSHPDIEVIDLPAGMVDVYGYVVDRAYANGSGGLFLLGLEASVSSRQTDHVALQSLNASRDLWEPRFHRPIVFWLPDYAARELTDHAHDFWRYLSHRFSFGGNSFVSPRVSRDVIDSQTLTAWHLSLPEKQARISELRARLLAADRSDPTMLVHLTNWTTELSGLLRMTGDLNAAEAACRDLLPLARTSPEAPAAALLWGQIADVLQDRGDLEGVLKIRKEEQLPVFERLGDVHQKVITMGRIADVLQMRGDLDAALKIRQEELPIYERLGDIRSKAITMGKIADIFQDRGDLDAALKIRQEGLPVFEQLGDIRTKAVMMGRIADGLQARGDLDAALKIRQEDELPVFERLGDIREHLVTMGKIADVLQARGDLDAALRVRQEELLPALERLGDVRAKAVTMGKIANILLIRGDLDAALQMHREEELPVYERLGASRDVVICQTNIASCLLQRSQPADRQEAARLLTAALHAAEQMRIPEANQIRRILENLPAK